MSRTPEVEKAMGCAKVQPYALYPSGWHACVITLAAEVERLEERLVEVAHDSCKWYTRCASLVLRVPSNVTAGEVQQWESDYKTELAKAEARVAELEAQMKHHLSVAQFRIEELEAQNARLREALEKLVSWGAMSDPDASPVTVSKYLCDFNAAAEALAETKGTP